MAYSYYHTAKGYKELQEGYLIGRADYYDGVTRDEKLEKLKRAKYSEAFIARMMKHYDKMLNGETFKKSSTYPPYFVKKDNYPQG